MHILDIMPLDGSDPVANYHAIRNELAQYSETLAEKDEVIVANKIDLDPDGSRLKDLRERLDRKIVPISAATGQGIKELTELLWQKIRGREAGGVVPARACSSDVSPLESAGARHIAPSRQPAEHVIDRDMRSKRFLRTIVYGQAYIESA